MTFKNIMNIEHTDITVAKIGNVYVATTIVLKPFRAETNMQGKTEAIAKEKLELFLKNEPYRHLDK